MKTYRAVWLGGCGIYVAGGVAAGFVVLPLAVWIVVGVLGGLLALIVGFAATTDPDRVTEPGPVVRMIALTCATLLAMSAYASFVGAGAFIPVLLMAAFAPPALRWYFRLIRGAGDRQALRAVGMDELCQRWLDSNSALSQACSGQARLRIVRSRQQCLDEMERRDPWGFEAWLNSTPGTASDPRRFLSDRGEHA